MDPLTTSLISICANLGFGGVIALLHWWTVKVEIPRRDAEAKTERDTALKVFREELAALRESSDKHVEAIVGRLDGLETKVDTLSRGEVRPRPLDPWAGASVSPAP